VSTQARSLYVWLITDPPLGPRAAAFKRDLENHRVVVEVLVGLAYRDMPQWIANLESRWDAAVVVPSGEYLMYSSVMAADYLEAVQVQVKHGRPRLFLSLVDGTSVCALYSHFMPTLLPEEPQEAVPLLIAAMKAKS
jgi:hypothetical protein